MSWADQQHTEGSRRGNLAAVAWYEDLGPCEYFGKGLDFRAVGWLERGKPFATGDTPADVYDRLKALFQKPFTPVALGGFHTCDLCQHDGARGALNAWIPGGGFLYVCPALIVHYIAAHHYAPPAEFQSAVRACPDMESMDYKRVFLENGGRHFLQSLKSIRTE
jgi:hypothetical protein